MTGLEASDYFWQYWGGACYYGGMKLPRSLAAAYREADVVITGQLVDFYVSTYRVVGDNPTDPEVPPSPLVFGRIEVVEVLKGDPSSRDPGYVEVEMGGPMETFEGLRQKIPSHDYVWFLSLDMGAYPGAYPEPDGDGYIYYTPDAGMPSIIRGIDGKVQVLYPDTIERNFGADQYPLPLDGTSFNEFVDRVRNLGDDSAMSASSAGAVSPRPAEPIAVFAC